MIDGETFTSEMSFEWSFSTAIGSGVEDSPLTIKMRMDIPPAITLSDGFKHPPTAVILEEIALDDPTNRVEIFQGRVASAKVKPSGQQGLVSLTVNGVKSRLAGNLGIYATSTCYWPFGDRGNSQCGVALAPITEAATVTGVNYNGVAGRVLLSFAGAHDTTPQRWVAGYVQVDECKIRIRRSVNDGTGRFDLREPIPPRWLGQPALLVPGCDGQLSTCRYWNNETNFLRWVIPCHFVILYSSNEHTMAQTSDELESRIVNVYDSWCSTPYMAGQQAKLIGVDCVQLIGGVLDELYRHTKRTFIPRIPVSSGMHFKLTGVRTSLAIRKKFPMRVTRDLSIEPGDIIVTRGTTDPLSAALMGHCLMAGVRPWTFIHAIPRAGVCWTSIQTLPKIVRLYRVMNKDTWL